MSELERLRYEYKGAWDGLFQSTQPKLLILIYCSKLCERGLPCWANKNFSEGWRKLTRHKLASWFLSTKSLGYRRQPKVSQAQLDNHACCSTQNRVSTIHQQTASYTPSSCKCNQPTSTSQRKYKITLLVLTCSLHHARFSWLSLTYQLNHWNAALHFVLVCHRRRQVRRVVMKNRWGGYLRSSRIDRR